MFENIRIKTITRDKYKDLMIGSSEKNRRKLLERYYSEMEQEDVCEVLNTLPIDYSTNFLFNKLNDNFSFYDLETNGIKLLTNISEDNRLKLIKNSKHLVGVDRKNILSLVLSFHDVDKRIEAINILGDLKSPYYSYSRLRDEDFGKILSSEGLSLKQRLDLLDKFVLNDRHKSYITDKGSVLLDILRASTDKEKIIALLSKNNANVKFKYKDEFMDIFKDMTYSKLVETFNSIDIESLKDEIGIELISEATENYNFMYLFSNITTNDEILENVPLDEMYDIFKYREDKNLQDDLGKIYKECFKYNNDIHRFINYVVNDKDNLFSDEYRIQLLESIRKVRDQSNGRINRSGKFEIGNYRISTEEILGIASGVKDKEKLLASRNFYYLCNIILPKVFRYENISFELFEKIEDSYRNIILRNMSNVMLEQEVRKNPNLIKYIDCEDRYHNYHNYRFRINSQNGQTEESFGYDNIVKLGNIAIKGGYNPNVLDVSKSKALKTNLYILEHLIKNGHPEVIEHILSEDEYYNEFYERLVTLALNNGYQINDRTFDSLGTTYDYSSRAKVMKKCKRITLLEEVLITGQYDKFKDNFDDFWNINDRNRISLLQKIIKDNVPEETDVLYYLDRSMNERVVTYILDKGYNPSFDFVDRLGNNKNILLKVVKKCPYCINYYKASSYINLDDKDIELYKMVIDIDPSVVSGLKKDIPELFNYAADKGFVPKAEQLANNEYLCKNDKIMMNAIKSNANSIIYYKGDNIDVYKSAIDLNNVVTGYIKTDNKEVYEYALSKGYEPTEESLKRNSALCRSTSIMLKAIEKSPSLIKWYRGYEIEVFKRAIDLDKNVVEFLKISDDNVYRYALDKGYEPTEESLKRNSALCRSTSIMLHMIELDFLYIHYCSDNLDSVVNLYVSKYGLNKDLFAMLFKLGKFGLIISSIGNDLSLVFDDKRVKILSAYKKIISNQLQILYIDYILKNYENLNMDTIDFISEILYKIDVSNSSEIQNFGYSFATIVLQNENPLETFNRVESIFIKNNIPICGKLFYVFKVMHGGDKLYNKIRGNSGIVSPTLMRFNSVSNDKLRNNLLDTVIFSDLLKASLGSNNRSMRDYLYNIEEGTKIFKSIRDGKNIETLTEEQKQILVVFANHLNTLYNNTNNGKNNPNLLSGNVEKDILKLENLFRVEDISKLPDRIISEFCHFCGIDSFEILKNYFEEVCKTTDLRNRAFAERGDFSIEKGDFVKGIDSNYIENILQNGSVAKEFLGDSAASDSTPLDTDLSRVLSNKGSLYETISDTAADSYSNEVWIILKDNGRFAVTRSDDHLQEDTARTASAIDQLEVFKTSTLDTNNSRHYGIRTGFASSQIDFLVVNNYTSRLGFEIARNGFYIPVVDIKTEKLVFTPENYDELRSKMSGMKYYGFKTFNFSNHLDIPSVTFNVNGEDIVIPSALEFVDAEEDSKKDAKRKRDAINETIINALSSLKLKTKTEFDGDLTENIVQFIDTGSTGRSTNMPGDGDFDFVMRLDREYFVDNKKMEVVKETLLKALDEEHRSEIVDGHFRFKKVKINGLENPVDIDITFIQKTNKVNYSTDMALKDRMSTMREQDYERYKYVVANILIAKKVLKVGECYKPARTGEQGGLGGVGVENWIVQNGGSFVEAARDFLEVANKCTNFDEFKVRYTINDFGENFKTKVNGYVHDNFVFNMNEEGYKKMKYILNEYIKSLNEVYVDENTSIRGR